MEKKTIKGARISFRVSTLLWENPERCRELAAFLGGYRGTVSEVAFFTGFTHPALPLATIRKRAEGLKEVMPRFKEAGLRCGVNHLATLGHLDENLENSLQEPWQHLVNIDGTVSKGCYCASDPEMREYIQESYRLLAGSGAEFIWVDDDVRMESHGPSIQMGCFCEGCLDDFARQTGKKWQREELVRMFENGPEAEVLGMRREWLEHNRWYLADLLGLIRGAIDEVDPTIQVGLMTGETSYSGYGFEEDVRAMAGARQVEVMWRPGGGFYEDACPSRLLNKAHSTGRQVALLPQTVTNIQYEHENFPYQVLKKSKTVFVAECAAAAGAGCTGVALNCMGISADPMEEFRPWFEAVQRGKGFLDQAVDSFGRSACEGVWPAFTRDHVAAQALNGAWERAPLWGTDFEIFNELFEIGLPPAYGPEGARVMLLTGATGGEFSREELLEFLRGGLVVDGTALQRLEALGLEEYCGWAVRGTKEKDTIEVLTADPLNGRFAGWQRDCRPSFWPEETYLLRPLSPGSRVLCEVIDFTPNNYGPCSGVFENKLGGRVAVLGYYPWRSVQNLAKTCQMKALVRWISRETVPGYIGSYHKAALWCRRTKEGRPAVMVMNASIDKVKGMKVSLQGEMVQVRVVRMEGETVRVERSSKEGEYGVFELPELGAWEAVVVSSS